MCAPLLPQPPRLDPGPHRRRPLRADRVRALEHLSRAVGDRIDWALGLLDTVDAGKQAVVKVVDELLTRIATWVKPVRTIVDQVPVRLVVGLNNTLGNVIRSAQDAACGVVEALKASAVFLERAAPR
jgi:hypothetical protein